jgi:HK97 family phage major capsid protein
MFILKEILKKEVADLTADEKGFLQENSSYLSAEECKKFGIEPEEEDPEEEDKDAIDEKSLQKLITENIKNNVGAKDIADQLVKHFMDGVQEQRAKVLAGEKIEKDEKKDDVTRQFMKALIDGDKAGAKALSTSSSGSSPDDAQAGLLIPTELMTEVLRIMPNFGLARRSMRYLPFSGAGNSRVIPALGTSVSVFWTNEKSKKKSTQPKFNLVTQTLKKLAAIVPFTEEILEDSAINLTALVGELFAEAVAKEEDEQFFAGTGTPWTGILNNGLVNKVYQGTAGVANLSADDLLAMQDATPSGALAGSKYYMNRTILSVVRKLKTQDLAYVFQNPGQGLPAQIWDYPYELSDAFPEFSSVVAGSPYILFGNLKLGAIFGDKQQLRVKLLEEATITDTDDQTEINLAEQDCVALRIVERVGYVIALPTALTVLDCDDAGSSAS